MRPLAVGLLAIAALAAAPSGSRTFRGVITDSMCATGDHSQMKMGPTDGECTIACIDVHGAAYVLYDGKRALTLSDQKTPEKFAGKKVTVTGTLDVKTSTIRVDSITPAK
jgi:type 1 fimbria pilin